MLSWHMPAVIRCLSAIMWLTPLSFILSNYYFSSFIFFLFLIIIFSFFPHIKPSACQKQEELEKIPLLFTLSGFFQAELRKALVQLDKSKLLRFHRRWWNGGGREQGNCSCKGFAASYCFLQGLSWTAWDWRRATNMEQKESHSTGKQWMLEWKNMKPSVST